MRLYHQIPERLLNWIWRRAQSTQAWCGVESGNRSHDNTLLHLIDSFVIKWEIWQKRTCIHMQLFKCGSVRPLRIHLAAQYSDVPSHFNSITCCYYSHCRRQPGMVTNFDVPATHTNEYTNTCGRFITIITLVALLYNCNRSTDGQQTGMTEDYAAGMIEEQAPQQLKTAQKLEKWNKKWWNKEKCGSMTNMRKKDDEDKIRNVLWDLQLVIISIIDNDTSDEWWRASLFHSGMLCSLH